MRELTSTELKLVTGGTIGLMPLVVIIIPPIEPLPGTDYEFEPNKPGDYR